MSAVYSARWAAGAARDELIAARDAIVGAFTWADSPQGEEAWTAVYDALDEMIDALSDE